MDEPVASGDDHSPGNFRVLFTNRHSRRLASDIDAVLFDIGAQLRAESFFRDQVDRTIKQVFQIKLHTKITFGGGGSIEGNQDVAFTIRRVPRYRAEQRPAGYAKAASQFLFAAA